MRARWIALAVLAASGLLAVPAAAAPSDYAFETATASLSTTQAGGHPDFHTLVKFTQELTEPFAPFGRTRDLSFELPPGMVGNPNVADQCTARQLAVDFANGLATCPREAQVGVTHVKVATEPNTLITPIFNMKPPGGGDVVARLGFDTTFFPVFIDIHLRSGSDYGLTATITSPPSQLPLIEADTTIWGVPAATSHDVERFSFSEGLFCGGPCGEPKSSGLPPAPFLSNPTSCGPLSVGIAADSYLEPERVIRASASLGEITGCGKVNFDPSLQLTPTSRAAGAPTGLDAKLTIPQDEDPKHIATSELRDATVTLPPGLTINPSAGDGLAACSAAQVGFGSDGASQCPDAARIGSATLVSPALSEPLPAAIYQRTPDPGNLFHIWLVADGQGVHLKIPGEVRADHATGQLTTTFASTPPLPAKEIQLSFKSGARAPLANPTSCGNYTSRYELAPWSGNPASNGSSPMTIDEGCPSGHFEPELRAGSESPVAGAYSPFNLSVLRSDGEPNIERLAVSLPPGELAKLSGVPVCGAAAAASGACPPSSLVGSVSVAAGAGGLPLWLPQPGKSPTAIYLGSRYRGAPYSLVVVVPAQAGPFDLGTVVTQIALFVDPESTRVTAESDPLPQILEGVPVRYRQIRTTIDRPSFALNPTNCKAMSVNADIRASSGQVASPRNRFQVGSCGQLGFKPKLAIHLLGGTRRGANPRLRAVLTARKGEANISRASVRLPHSEFLDNSHLQNICTRVQFAAEECPTRSVYGRAVAKSPLLDEPLTGPVYLRSSSNELPDLVADLRGQIHVVLDGRIDSVNGGIRTVFAAVPDAPVTKFTLTMKGGDHSLIENSTDLCAGVHRATVQMRGQNGARLRSTPPVSAKCEPRG